jgi:hypothetical protein
MTIKFSIIPIIGIGYFKDVEQFSLEITMHNIIILCFRIQIGYISNNGYNKYHINKHNSIKSNNKN